MQVPVVIAQMRQTNGFARPAPARFVLGGAVEVYCSVEGRCCYPFEFFSWIATGLLFGRSELPSVGGMLVANGIETYLFRIHGD